MKQVERPLCNDVMIPGRGVRKLLGWKNIRCTLDPGHAGNHSCKTKSAYFEWWNKQANPQREAT